MIKVIWVAMPDLNGENRRQTLEMLGYNPFDLMEMLSDKQKYIDWNTFMMAGQEHDYDWETFLNGRDALVLMYNDVRIIEFTQKYPDCKVIFEDIPYEKYQPRLEAYLSFLSLVKKFKRSVRRASRTYTSGMKALITLFGDDYSSENVKSKMPSIVTRLTSKVPKWQKLVITDINYTWKDLCQFLEVDIPQETMPKASNHNSYAPVFNSILIEKIKNKWFLPIIYVLITVVVLFYILFTYLL